MDWNTGLTDRTKRLAMMVGLKSTDLDRADAERRPLADRLSDLLDSDEWLAGTLAIFVLFLAVAGWRIWS